MKKTVALICSVCILCLLFIVPVHADKNPYLGSNPVSGSSGGVDYRSDSACRAIYFMNADGSTGETDRCTTNSANNLWVSTSDTIPRSATVPSGYSGYSRDFELSDVDYLQGSDHSDFDVTGNITVACWMMSESITSVYNTQTLVNKHANSDGFRGYLLRIYRPSTDGQFRFDAGLSSNGTAFTWISSTSSTYTTGTWYHVALVYNGTDMRLYVNGSLASTPVSYSSGIYNNSRDFFIGAGNNGIESYDGLIDEVIVLSKALSSSEVSDLYTNGVSGNKGGSD